LTDEKEDEGVFREDTAGWIAAVCRDIRSQLKNPERELIILKGYLLKELNEKEVSRMISQGTWSDEVAKRLGKKFNFKVFADIILPVKCGAHWVLIACNFEKRQIHIVYF
jgi:hypothetical protein